VRIRPAEPQDLDVLVALFEELHTMQLRWRVFEPRTSLIEEARARYRDVLRDPGALVVLAEDGSGSLGMGIATVDVPSTSSDEPALAISNVYVREAARGGGIGSAMVAELVAFGRARGLTKSTIRVFSGNRDAIGFWSRLGFEPLLTVLVAPLPDPSSGGS
jgi:ribosomal protein S18 acetylase RimI-like enzyme